MKVNPHGAVWVDSHTLNASRARFTCVECAA